MTPPASPPLTTTNATRMTQPMTVPSSTAAALSKMAQAAHSWRPEEAARLAEQAWQDTVLSTAGLGRSTDVADSKDSTANLWDFIDPTLKSSCICVK